AALQIRPPNTQTHKKDQHHVHHGYFHSENDGQKGAARLSDKEKRMVDRVRKLWNNYLTK
ncbi:MAG: hypothetical protein IKM19_09320, partial [Firmicutes bacterium]|nr:hypothetical protein [Bacillota bacterium]